jgi:MoaA/NifB/PqqE/SkfB family radical SAM enzyme
MTTWIRRKVLAVARRNAEVRLFAAAMASTSHPVLAQVVAVRRCNLACAYCNEFDTVSHPVPLEEMLRRIDRLGELRTSIIMLTGGEPLLHPDLDAILARIRSTGAMAAIITNGYLLTPARIDALGRAGLQYMQISIDNVVPDGVSKKSLSLLDRRLEWLAARAVFAVTINTVLAPGLRDPTDAVTIARRARALGFANTVGILHDGTGRAKPLPPEHLAVYEDVRRRETGVFTFTHFSRFQDNLARGSANDWHCGAGGRFLYVCEKGLVHYCSQQRGRPGIALADYLPANVERERLVNKPCAPHCSLSCVHQVAFLDEVRERPREMLRELIETRRANDPAFRTPWLLRAAAWAFLENRHAVACGRFAARLAGVGPARGGGVTSGAQAVPVPRGSCSDQPSR